jgi:hypothetical protein
MLVNELALHALLTVLPWSHCMPSDVSSIAPMQVSLKASYLSLGKVMLFISSSIHHVTELRVSVHCRLGAAASHDCSSIMLPPHLY